MTITVSPAEGSVRLASAGEVRLLTGLSVDGRRLRYDHAVLLLPSSAAEEWAIAVLGIADNDFKRLAGQHLARFVDARGTLLRGLVNAAVDQSPGHVRLEGVGALCEIADGRQSYSGRQCSHDPERSG